MTTFGNTAQPIQTTDAAYQTNVNAILAGIDAVLTRTSDTGQINTSGMVRPSTNTATGYAMWRIPGGTQDVFMKMEFGTGSFAQNPSFWLTFGTVTNGSGTLSGATTARRQIAVGAATATSYDCLYSATTGRFSMTLYANNPTQGDIFCISLERDWDATGTAVETYYWACYANGNGNSRWNRCVRVSGDIGSEFSNLPGCWPSESTSHLLGVDVACYPIRPRYGTERNPTKNWIVVGSSDIAYGIVFNADIYGAAATWIRTGCQPSSGTSNDANNRMCMRWE